MIFVSKPHTSMHDASRHYDTRYTKEC